MSQFPGARTPEEFDPEDIESPSVIDRDLDHAPAASDEQGPKPAPHVVGIGASAGGLEALERLFRSLPADSGMAFVVVQHLSPDFRSFMGELLARQTSMRIVRVEDGMAIEPDSVYLIPPKKNLLLVDGRLRLTEQDHSHGLNLPIDVFFRSLARDCGGRSIGIVLSGTGSDGTRGIRAIKEAGGMVMVQDEQTAKFDGMPRSAIATGLADYILPPEEMPERLLDYIHQHDPSKPNRLFLIAGEDHLAQIFSFLRRQHGLDFSLYKPKMIARRIERRMIIRQIPDIERYVELLRESPEELRTLYNELLIGVTKFFRDAEAFRRIARDVIPKIVEATPPSRPIRAWVAGCSTGEEAYSLAILFCEYLDSIGKSREVKIYATDVDERAIQYASVGVYPESIAADLSRERLERFFSIKGDAYRVAPRLRQMILFAPHNLTRDPPFTKIDLICCRNLLIYLQPELQRRLLLNFHFALNSQGYLLLGASETVGDLDVEFTTVDIKWKIYRKKRDVWLPPDSRLPIHASTAGGPMEGEVGPRGRPAARDATLVGAYEGLVETCLPPCLLVDAHNQLIHVFGDAARFLKVPSGKATRDVVKMVQDELAMVLATALHRAANQENEVAYTNVQARDVEGPRTIKIRVKKLPPRRGEDMLFVVFFEEVRVAPGPAAEEVFEAGSVASQRIADLEHELRQTRENLQATIEELESSNEELQAANEELLASNEELQSTNEELHSVNEELYAVNAEHQSKIQELIELNNDIDNLFQSTEIGTVFLDRDLCVRKFTPAIAGKINLLPQDIGRPIQHISHSLQIDDLLGLVREVLATGKVREERVGDHSGRSLLMRLLPYRAADQTIVGVVMTFVDIEAVVAAERALGESRSMLQSTLDSLAAHIAILAEDGRILAVNAAWRRFAERSGASGRGVGSNYLEACESTEGEEGAVAQRVAQGLRDVRDGRRDVFTIEYPCHSATERRWFLLRATRFRAGNAVRLVVAHDDITDRVVAEEEILRSSERVARAREEAEKQAEELRRTAEAIARRNDELSRINRELDDFAHIASHDLKEPLEGLRLYAGLLRSDLGELLDERAREQLLALEKQALYMDDMVTSLLAYSRVSRQVLASDPIDLHLVVLKVIESIRSFTESLDVQFVLPQRLPVVEGDRVLAEVFRNLIANAIKYNDKPQRRVEIGFATDRGETVFHVRDNGIGIQERHRESIFEIFRRLHPRERFGGGTGAGLSITRRIIERHGGKIWVESTPGAGTTFFFTLGRGVSDATDPPIEENSAPGPSA